VANMQERRRIKKRFSIRFGIDEAVMLAFTEDISMTGMFIKTFNVIPPNSRIKIKFDLPEGSGVELEARVMWAKKVPANLFNLVKKSGMGVRFIRFYSGEDAFNDFFERSATTL
jgi:PilZ domain-containing protein